MVTLVVEDGMGSMPCAGHLGRAAGAIGCSLPVCSSALEDLRGSRSI